MPKKEATRRREAKKLTEHQIQSRFFVWAAETEALQTDRRRRLALRWMHAIPNGYHKSIPARMKAKREGVKSGIADVFTPAPQLSSKGGTRLRGLPVAGYAGLYIEFKRKGGRVSPEQREFLDYLGLVNYAGHVVIGDWRHAAWIVVDYLDLGVYAQIIQEGDQ